MGDLHPERGERGVSDMERLLLLLPALGVNGQQGRPPPCSGSFLQENITLEVGSPISIGCPLTHCPDKSSLTWQVAHARGEPRAVAISESGDPFNFLIRNAHPEESGWYWCVSGDFEFGQHVAVVVPPPPPTSPPPTVPAPLPSFPPQMSTTEESVQEQMGPLKVYNRFETKWTERQARKIEIYQEVEEILARHLASIHSQLEDLYQRLGRLERKAATM